MDSQCSLQSMLSRAQKDAAWLSQFHFSPGLHHTMLCKIAVMIQRSKAEDHVFGPLLDSPPAHPDTVLSTMAYLDISLRQLSMSHRQSFTLCDHLLHQME